MCIFTLNQSRNVLLSLFLFFFAFFFFFFDVSSIPAEGGHFLLNMGGTRVTYNPSFLLYLTSSLSSPHFPPEVYAQTCVIDCTVTPQGLVEQLLARVMSYEAPEMELRHNELVTHTASDKKQLHIIEEGLLQLLYQVQKREKWLAN